MHRVLAEPAVAAFEPQLGRETVKAAVGEILDAARGADRERAYGEIVTSAVEALEGLRLQALVPVVNATGIIVHTNLGRAPLAGEALAAVAEVCRGYANLEYDLAEGERGSRYERAAGALRELTGAQDALVVNNCAAAVLLVLDTFAKGREVVVARSELVEIGGGFRVPEVLERSGAALVEVGTTNRVYVSDFERALSPRTALFLRTHPSNYRIEGFTHEAAPRELAELGKRSGVPVVEDLGSGALCDLEAYGLPHERTACDALADGATLVTFSGDKLLGGPQAGIVVGRAPAIARLRGNPLLRALRVDKMTLAALSATLELHAAPAARARIPIYAMIGATLEDLRARALPYLEALPGAQIVDGIAYLGGGSLPQAQLPSLAIALASEAPDRTARALRRGTPPIVGRIERGRLLFDLRTILPQDDRAVVAALARVTG